MHAFVGHSVSCVYKTVTHAVFMAEKDRFVSPAGFRLYRLSSAPGSYSLFCRFRSWLQREAAMARVTKQRQQDGSVLQKVQRGYLV